MTVIGNLVVIIGSSVRFRVGGFFCEKQFFILEYIKYKIYGNLNILNVNCEGMNSGISSIKVA